MSHTNIHPATATATATAGSASSKAVRSETHCVIVYTNGLFGGVLAGMGRNKGTWDTGHSRSAAYRHARQLRRERPQQTFKVEAN